MEAVQAVLEHSHSSGPSRLFLIVLAHHANNAGDANIDVATLKLHVGVKETRLKQLTQELQNLGELMMEPHAGPRNTNIYHILLPIDAGVNTGAPPVAAARVSESDLIRDMTAIEIPEHLQQEFLRSHTREFLREQLDCLQDRNPRDPRKPGGLFVTCVRSGHAPPPRYYERLRRESAPHSGESHAPAMALRAIPQAASHQPFRPAPPAPAPQPAQPATPLRPEAPAEDQEVRRQRAIRFSQEGRAVMDRSIPRCHCPEEHLGSNAATRNTDGTAWVCYYGKCNFTQPITAPADAAATASAKDASADPSHISHALDNLKHQATRASARRPVRKPKS